MVSSKSAVVKSFRRGQESFDLFDFVVKGDVYPEDKRRYENNDEPSGVLGIGSV